MGQPNTDDQHGADLYYKTYGTASQHVDDIVDLKHTKLMRLTQHMCEYVAESQPETA